VFSIGPYVLTGGELPALVMTDAIARHVPGVLGKEASLAEESWSDGEGEYPQYTRPETWLGIKVPKILLSGHHKDIEAWKKAHRMH
jgi:tRNA (guanine37-N1)-methyltransferase